MLTLMLKKKIAGNPEKRRVDEKAGGVNDLALPDIKAHHKTTIIIMIKYRS